MVAINDLTARNSALQSRAVDLINRVDPKTVSLLTEAANIEIINVPSAGHYLFAMRCDTAPFDNADLRLALKYGIDRQDIVDRILGGYGTIGSDHRSRRSIPSTRPICRNMSSIRIGRSITSRNRASAGR